MYVIKNTERNNQISSDYETKSLLYLLAMRSDSEEIDNCVIDCFNDVSGCDETFDKIWDVQSKGVRSLTPNTIGKALVTLYKNYTSEINFNYYILFIPKLKEGYLDNEDLKVYGINNFNKNSKIKVKDGLFNEHERREKVECKDIIINRNDVKLDDFLERVTFVIAEDEKEIYIKNIIDFKNKKIKDEQFFNTIFDEIKNKQTALKNLCVEGIRISNTREILADRLLSKKIIRKSEIEILVINRLIGTEVFSNEGIRPSFIKYISDMDEEDVKDLIQECNEQISRTLFNKNTKKPFWRLLECIVKILRNDPKLGLDDIYNSIPKIILRDIYTLDEIGIKYFTSLIKDGIMNDKNK